MENKEYLNEENYQKSKNKISKVALIVLIVGILLGGSLITVGIVKSNSGNESMRTQVDIQNEIDLLEEQLIPLKVQKNQEFSENGFTETYYRLQNQIDTKQSKINELEIELRRMKSGFDSVSKTAKYTSYYMFGGFIIVASLMMSGSIYMISKRREIMAFTAQQIMPVAQEGIEKMAPTVGKVGKSIVEEMAPVYGEVAKEIAKGIKEGMKEDNQEKEE